MPQRIMRVQRKGIASSQLLDAEFAFAVLKGLAYMAVAESGIRMMRAKGEAGRSQKQKTRFLSA
jgi:hypothetical protein